MLDNMLAVKPLITELPEKEHDEACFDTRASVSSLKKRRASVVSPCPTSPKHSLVSESKMRRPSSPTMPPAKRRKRFPRGRISFALDNTNRVKASLKTFEKEYDEEDVDAIWWSEDDLKQIMKREGRLVLSINNKLNGCDSSATTDSVPASIKKSINDTFKQCVNKPMVTEMPVAHVYDEESTTTRGLERYIAPIMGAHSKMSIKSLLQTQEELAHCDPATREEALQARYQHLSKVSANFAIVLAEWDAQMVEKF